MSNLTSLRSKLFYPKESFWVAGVATIVASILLKVVVLEVHFPKIIYNLVIIALLVYVVTRSLIKLATVGHVKEQVTHFKLVSTGLVGGLIAGFTGLAGGSIVIPMLNLWLKINIKKAKAITFTTIFFIALLLTIINLSHRPTLPLPIAHIGYIILPIAIPLALGVMVASPVGVLLGQKVSDKTISLAFITVILLVLVRKSIELINW